MTDNPAWADVEAALKEMPTSSFDAGIYLIQHGDTIKTALKSALRQPPAGEPVAWAVYIKGILFRLFETKPPADFEADGWNNSEVRPLYASPPAQADEIAELRAALDDVAEWNVPEANNTGMISSKEFIRQRARAALAKSQKAGGANFQNLASVKIVPDVISKAEDHNGR